MKWAGRFCKGRYLLKTDDDVFVTLRPFMTWLIYQPKKEFYAGQCQLEHSVSRDGKW